MSSGVSLTSLTPLTAPFVWWPMLEPLALVIAALVLVMA
jgi:hypothetical protein